MYNMPYYINPVNEDQYDYQKSQKEYLDRQIHESELRDNYNTFSAGTKAFLISESINYILQKCLEGKSPEEQKHGRVLCERFVEEQGSYKLLSRFKKESLLLAEMAQNIEETYSDIMCGVDKDNKSSFVIKPADKKNFYDGLEKLSVCKVVDKINKRVCDAEEDFIQANINDKLDMEEIATKTKERIDSIKNQNKETEDAIKQEYASMYRKRVDEIRNNRTRNIYEQMINSTANTVVKDQEKYSMFVSESGGIDMDQITETVDTMYRFIETLNTAKIHKIDEAYLSELLDSLK